MKRRNFIQGGLSVLIGAVCGVKVAKGVVEEYTVENLQKEMDKIQSKDVHKEFIPSNGSYMRREVIEGGERFTTYFNGGIIDIVEFKNNMFYTVDM